MAGLIETNMDLTKQVPNPLAGGPLVSQAKSFGYDPTLSTVNLPTDTVSGQLKGLLEHDNPYITMARQSAAEAANARGMLNTTMATQAGEAAAIGAATPIAAADAGIFSTRALANQGASNTASTFNAGEANKAGIINSAAVNEFGKIGATETAQENLLRAKQEGDISLQTLQGTQALGQQTQAQKAATDLATLNNNATSALNVTLQNMRGIQAFDTASLDASVRAATSAGANVTSLTNAAAAEVGRINALPNLTDAQRQTMIGDVSTQLTNSIATLTAAYTVPLGNALVFAGPTATLAATTTSTTTRAPVVTTQPPAATAAPEPQWADNSQASTNVREFIAANPTPQAIQGAIDQIVNAGQMTQAQAQQAVYTAGAGVLTPEQINTYMGW